MEYQPDYAQIMWEAQMRNEMQAEDEWEREAAMKHCHAQGVLSDLIDLLAEGEISREDVLEIVQADLEAEIEEAGRNQQELPL